MTLVRRPNTVLSVVSRLVVYILIGAQAFLLFAPLLEARLGPDSPSHVEAAGTRIHHSHNPSDCALCAARGLLADPGRAADTGVEAVLAVLPPVSERPTYFDFLRKSDARPRAPPRHES